MKKILPIIIFVVISMKATAQNLVPNWSFEDTVGCPIGIGDMTKATGWSSYGNTPDYMNACNNGQAGVPANFCGYQDARTGNAYGGFVSFTRSAANVREIMGRQLSQPLTIGQQYFVKFFV